MPELNFVNDSTIEVEVNALMNVKADEYIAIFSVMQSAETLDECHTLINKRINGFTSQTRKLGLESEHIFVDFISQVPRYEFTIEKKRLSRTYNEVPAGFDLQKNIHIAFTENNMFDSLLIIAARNEIYDLVKVEYIVRKPEVYYDSLRNVALNAINKIFSTYKKAGFEFNPTFRNIVENCAAYYPENLYDSYSAFSSASVWTSKSVKYDDKKTTSYYNRLPYAKYHFIINPLNVEPSVQFSYQMKVRVVVKRTK